MLIGGILPLFSYLLEYIGNRLGLNINGRISGKDTIGFTIRVTGMATKAEVLVLDL